MNKKIITVFVLLFFFANTAETGAALKGEPPELTVSEAVFLAERRSSELKTLDENIYLAELKRPSITEALIYTPMPSSQIVALSAAVMQSDLARASLAGNALIMKKIIELTVTRYFIITEAVERELELYDRSLAISKKNFEINETMARLGMLGESELVSARLSYEKELAERDDKVSAIDGAYRELNRALGSNPEKRYRLVSGVEYVPLRDRNLSGYIESSVEKNIKIKNKKSELEAEEFNLANGYGQKSMEELKATAAQTARALSDMKKDLAEKIRACRSDIMASEVSYETCLIELESAKMQLEVKKTQLELGRITRLETDALEYQIAMLEYRLSAVISEHYMLVMQFENPDLF